MKEFLEYLEERAIFFPIDKIYHSPPTCHNFFTEVASLGEANTTLVNTIQERQ
jgi:hypothetical protein